MNLTIPQKMLLSKYQAICTRIEELEALVIADYKTNGDFRYNPTNNYSEVNIKRSEVSELINVHAFITMKAKQYNDSAAAMGITSFPVFTWMGFTPEQWIHDIMLRKNLKDYQAELENLKATKAKIEPFLPQDVAIEKLLAELSKINTTAELAPGQ